MLAITLSALFSGIVAIGVSVAIERLGGRLGGVLGTLPSTIVPAALGIFAQQSAAAPFADAIGSAPVGMLLNVLFLYLWRVLPPRLPPRAGLGARLALMIVVSLGAWLVAALVAVRGVTWLGRSGVAPLRVGELASLAILLVGLAALRARVPAPKGTRGVSWRALAARGLFAALSVGVAVSLARAELAVISGVAAVFPAIFLTTMVSLWISQAEAVPAGAVGPMMLGSASIGLFCVIAARSMPAWGAGLGVAFAWTVAVGLVTLPAAWALGRRHSGSVSAGRIS